jgi:hypothetical protein
LLAPQLTKQASDSEKNKKKEPYVGMGRDNWFQYPKDVQDVRADCLQRLFVYGTHPENFSVDPSSPDRWQGFVGYLLMRLSRNPESLEVMSVDLRITTFLDKKKTRRTTVAGLNLRAIFETALLFHRVFTEKFENMFVSISQQF